MFADRRIRTSLFAIGADLFLTLVKAGLAIATGSAALLADAYHSGTDLVISLVLLGSLVIRYRQEQKGSEAVSNRARQLESWLAIGVSLLILYVPVEILLEVQASERRDVHYLGAGIAGVLVILAVVYFMARLKTHVGRETDSLALEADGYHSKIDLFTTLAVLVSFIGLMVGVYLDELVALVIALLIAVAGVELLVSGIASLRQGRTLDPVSLLEPLLERLAPGRWVKNRVVTVARLSRRFAWVIPVGLLVVWLGTAIHQVPLGHLGVKTHLGAPVATPLEPGLHTSWPWPFGQVIRVPNGELRAVRVGSRTSEKGLWRDLNAVQARDDDTQYLVTRDESLIDLELAIQYRLRDPSGLRLRVADIDAMVHRHAQAALWHTTAQYRFDDLLLNSHAAFTTQVADTLRKTLGTLGLELEIVDSQLLSLQPPAMVVGAYRDLLNAEQEKQQYQNRAEGQRTHDLLMARAERVRAHAQTLAEADERLYRAEGEIERFLALAEVYRTNRSALQFEQHLEAFSTTLSKQPLWLLDPNLPPDDIRLWGPAGLLKTHERP